MAPRVSSSRKTKTLQSCVAASASRCAANSRSSHKWAHAKAIAGLVIAVLRGPSRSPRAPQNISFGSHRLIDGT